MIKQTIITLSVLASAALFILPINADAKYFYQPGLGLNLDNVSSDNSSSANDNDEDNQSALSNDNGNDDSSSDDADKGDSSSNSDDGSD